MSAARSPRIARWNALGPGERAATTLPWHSRDPENSSYGYLHMDQRDAVRRAVAGKHVVDLGAGNLQLSHQLRDLGAVLVTAVESQPFAAPSQPEVRLVCTEFERFQRPDGANVAFVSWCDVAPKPELITLLEGFDAVIHLSKNTDDVVCGWPALYEYLQTRRITEYLPHRRNTLVIYGTGPVVRPARHEERAGATTWLPFPGPRYEALGEEMPD